MSALTMAVLLSLVSAISYALAAIVQERLATTTAASRWGLLRSGMWWTAAVLQGSGALLHVVALGLGPLTVVQPLGVLTLVLAAPMAALLGRRPVTPAAWRGIVLVSAGLAGILLLTSDRGTGSLDGGGQLALAAWVLGSVALLVSTAVAARRTGGSRPGNRVVALRSVSLALAAGIAYGAASVFVKTLADSWTSEPLAASVPLAALTVALAVTGLASSQASYRDGGLATPLATATVANPVVAAAAGILLLGEGFRYGAVGTVLAVGAGAVAAWGLVVLTSDSARQARAEETPHAQRPERHGRKSHGGARTAEAEFASRHAPQAAVPGVVVPGPRAPAGRRPVPAP
ncbi:DMT family transporter [Streptomyces spirodelae]|uniref:DMT family transporter n=1 Tax=Streptomyces spirodelae TaxID=2812904 RepID=A0ABS3WZR1_9ACTN|nr:DMT family transporter [Streptomyces spirodelae]MBO8188566.1 DMT family transporter [Streptomyces spirodelae]